MSKRTDLMASIALLVLGVGVCVEARRLGFGSIHAPEPGFFPWLGGLALTGLSAGLLIRALRCSATEATPAAAWRRPALLLVALAAYVPLLEPLGYPVATTALCIVALRILRTRRFSVMLGVSVLLAVGTFLLFHRELGVELPVGTLFFGG